MKTIKPLLSLLLCISTSLLFAQSSGKIKPKLFSAYPEIIKIDKHTLQNTINISAGKEVTLTFNNDFVFTGTVFSNLKKYDNLQSMMIRSTAYGNAIFQLSKITNEDKSISYAGRIINPEAFDGYEMKHDKNDNYTFIKFETKKILEDCGY